MEIVKTANEEWNVGDEPARPDASPTPNIERMSWNLMRNIWLMILMRKIKVRFLSP